MVRTLALAALLALGAVAAHADLLEISGFGGYTSLAMGQVNSALGDYKNQAGIKQATTTDVSNGYLAGLDVRTGALIPIPFFEIGLKGEYIGASAPGQTSGTNINTGESYDFKDDPSLVAGMLGLDFAIGIPATPLKFGLSAYGGYGEGFVRESETLGPLPAVTSYYNGGGFVGELEGRLDWHLVSVLSFYAFGGYRAAGLGTFSDGPVKFTAVEQGYAAPKVDFSGATGGGGLNFDF